MIKASLAIDNAVGEDRRVLVGEDGRAFRIEIERWSERGHCAKVDEIWWGRAHARMPGRGWFVHLSNELEGILETKASITEGAIVPVRVKSEAWGAKGCVLSLADMPALTPRPDKPGLFARPADDPFLAGVEIVETLGQLASREAVDFAIEEATSVRVPIPGGGRLTIEPTSALTAIDVDTGGRFAVASLDREINIAAADEAARQIALRNTGGLVAVDFVTMQGRDDRVAVVERLRTQLAQRLGRATKVLDISTLGLCEIAVARRARPLSEALSGASPAEREGLDALRAIEREAPGRPSIDVTVSREAEAWLNADSMGWRAQLAARIGSRLNIRVEDRPPGRPAVIGRGGND